MPQVTGLNPNSFGQPLAVSNAINVGWENYGTPGGSNLGAIKDSQTKQQGGQVGSWDYRSGSPVFTPQDPNAMVQLGMGLPTSGVGQAPKTMNSIYSPADPRYGNQLFNQNTGAFGASANNTAMAGSATGQGGYAPGAAPNLESLTNMINQLNLSGQQASNAGRIPNATGLETQSSGNIGQELAGQVPQDVINLLQQQGAERGVGMGSPGSDNSNAAYLRALGLTSLQQQQLGQQNLSAALARNPGARVFDPTSQLLTPYQAGDLNYKNALLNSGFIRDFLNSGGAFPQGARHYGLANDLNPFAQTPDAGKSWFPTAGGTPGMPMSPPPTGGSASGGDPFDTYWGPGSDFANPGYQGNDFGGELPPLTPQDYMNAGYDPFAQL